MYNTVALLTCFYAIGLVAMIIIMPHYPNEVTWYNTIIDGATEQTVEHTYTDNRWTSLFIIFSILTLTVLILSTLTFKQLHTDQNRNIGRHYVTIFTIWFIIMFIAGSMIYRYKPDYIPPYPKSITQFKNTPPSCELYYTSHNYTNCYVLLTGLNATNNNVCCINIIDSHYDLNISMSGLITLLSVMLYPVWLVFCYYMLSNPRRTYFILN